MHNFLSINNISFTFIGYQMSYLEFFGTIFNLWCVYLAAKNKILTWPIGIVGIILYLFLFYQIQLYSDFFEQIYFLITSFYGWFLWRKIMSKNKSSESKQLQISYNALKNNIIVISLIILGTVLTGYFMQHIHLYFPKIFPVQASFPFLDALTTVMSFIAQFLMAKRKIECWYLWILVDIIGIGLYYIKGVKFISLEYLIFLCLAIKGLVDWQKQYHNQIIKGKI
ncbi:MAG: nicotinamide riboside transporter PnuC [Patescibacteria group bacterium]|nr:nicotinamide riboside transporter PnuC [Patescibacteria group bacterium]